MTKKKKTSIIISLTLVIIVACIAAVILFVQSSSPSRQFRTQLDLGYKYLENLEYEQAIVAFEAAIEIDPKNVEAYKCLVDTYIQMGDDQLAIEAAQRAYDETEDEWFLRIIDELSETDEQVEIVMDEDGDAKSSPEAEINELNYIPIEKRSNYVDYDNLSSGEQQFVDIMFNAMINENFDKIHSMSISQYFDPKAFYTFYNGYKIYVRYTDQLVLIDEGNEEILEMEIRPENGVGYSLQYDTYTGWRNDLQGNRGYKDNYTLEWGRCNCSNWVFSGEGYDYTYSFESDGFEHISTCSGTIVDGLRDGVWMSDWKVWGNADNSGQEESLYIYGRWKKEGYDEPFTSFETLVISYGTDDGVMNQWVWDAIHW